VRFQVVTAASMKFRVLWDVVPCSLIVVDRRFRGVYCLHHQGDECPDDGEYAPLKRRSATVRLSGDTSQKTLHFKAIVVSSLLLCKIQLVPLVLVPSFLKIDTNQTVSMVIDLYRC
jgi:hypothetical protein